MTLPALRAASLAAALVLLPGVALAETVAQTLAPPDSQTAAEAFEARMDAFRRAAAAVDADADLDPAQKTARILALWAEQKPHLELFAADAAHEGRRAAADMAADMLAQMDVAAITAAAMAEVAPRMRGVMTNSAWARLDPDQMVTYGLVAQYGVNLAMDALDAAQAAPPAALDAAPCAA
jgi:hypothetical protein